METICTIFKLRQAFYGCEYLTYKEWKLLSDYTNSVWGQVLDGVSTLPIRNGNGSKYYYREYHQYSEYLTYKEWKLSVLIPTLTKFE